MFCVPWTAAGMEGSDGCMHVGLFLLSRFHRLSGYRYVCTQEGCWPWGLRGTKELASFVQFIQNLVNGVKRKPSHQAFANKADRGCPAQELPTVSRLLVWADAAMTAGLQRPPQPGHHPPPGLCQDGLNPGPHMLLDDSKISDKKLFGCHREHILTAQRGGIITEWCKRSKIISDKPWRNFITQCSYKSSSL